MGQNLQREWVTIAGNRCQHHWNTHFVSEIIVHGTNIVCEFDSMGGYQRVVVLRGRMGCAVLAPWSNGDDGLFYSVVTAYRNRATNGKAVARVRGLAKP